jgi:hypothetical protein
MSTIKVTEKSMLDVGVIIRFAEKKYISAKNPKGIVPGRFDITPEIGVYKHGKGKDVIRWFRVDRSGDQYSAVEIEVSEVYHLLKAYGKWLQPDSLNAASSRKYRPVYEWLVAQRHTSIIKCSTCGTEHSLTRSERIALGLDKKEIPCSCGNQLDIKGDDD